MPHKDFILNLPSFTIKKVSGYLPLILDVHYRRRAHCTFCQGKHIRKKASFIRNVKHESIGHRPMILRFKAYKFYCSSCHRYFIQQFPGIGKKRATERLQTQIFHQHAQGISGQTLAHNFRLGKATIERRFHQEP